MLDYKNIYSICSITVFTVLQYYSTYSTTVFTVLQYLQYYSIYSIIVFTVLLIIVFEVLMTVFKKLHWEDLKGKSTTVSIRGKGIGE